MHDNRQVSGRHDMVHALRQQVHELKVLATCRGLQHRDSHTTLQQLMLHLTDLDDDRIIPLLVSDIDSLLGRFHSNLQTHRNEQGLKLRATIKDGASNDEEIVESDS
jgi:hypothetical protein